MKPILVFCHGFGLYPDYWRNLAPLFSNYPMISWNLGYFSKPQTLQPPSHHPLIAIGHSLGWYKLQQANLNIQLSIGIQAFTHFCGFQAPLHTLRTQELERLQQQFVKNPRGCLHHFYKRCGLIDLPMPSSSLNLTALQHDLDLLKIPLAQHINKPCLIIGSTHDPIVTEELIYDNFQNIPNAHIRLTSAGTHHLGHSQPRLIHSLIQDFIHEHAAD